MLTYHTPINFLTQKLLLMKKQVHLSLLFLMLLPLVSVGQSIEILPGNDGKGNIISNSGTFPTMHMFPNGVNNPDRMIISHSPAFNNWGLQYKDSEDDFVFLAGGFPNLYLDLGTSINNVKVGIGTDSPQETFHVMGNIRVQNTYPYTTYYKSNSIGNMGNLFYEGISPAVLKGFVGYNANSDIIQMYNSAVSANHLTIKTSGFVGLGTDNASQKLNIVDGNILLESGATDRAYIQQDGAFSGGQVTLYTSNGSKSLEVKASDATNKAGEILLYDPTTNAKTIEIDGDWGGSGKSRIVTDELQITGGSDFAEYFDVNETVAVQPGYVMSALTDGSGKLNLSADAYDKKVVGIVSGANGVSTGLMLRQKDNDIVNGAHPIAISGRVYVYADAAYGKIQVGDLLTTSATAGHAMKCKNHRKGRGATIGKALSNLEKGRGFVLILLDAK